MKKIFFTGLFLLFFAIPFQLGAYSSITVPVQDPVYRQLNKLAAFGLIKTMMTGQKPYVRSEIGRLIAEAIKNYPEFEAWYREAPDLDTRESAKRLTAKVQVDQILRKLKFQYRQELIQRGVIPGEVPTFAGKIVDYIRGDFIYLDEDKSQIVPNNGLGGTNAILQPLVQYREGRHYQKGANWSFETHHWVRLGKYFSMQVEPRFQAQLVRAPLQNETKLFVQRANARFTIGKFDLEVGRDSVDWGATHRGGLVFSTNPRPMDFIKISSISPFKFPFFFKYLGDFEMSFFAANLGPEQNFRYPWLLGHKISSRRNEYFEFGFSHIFEFGGEGAPTFGFGQGFLDYFNLNESPTRENKAIQIEFIGRIPQFRGLELYAEWYMEDLTSNLNTMFLFNSSYLGGIYIPRLNFAGTLDLRLEFRRLSPKYSRSTLFIDGFTLNKLLIGDPQGPDSLGLFLELFYDLNPRNLLSFSFNYFHRNNNVYQQNGSSIIQLADLGDESRFVYQIGLRRIFNRFFVGRLGLGLEQVHNVNFTQNNALNWMAEAGFTVYLQPHVSKQSIH